MEIALLSERGCATIAATDPKDIGERCDADELGPIVGMDIKPPTNGDREVALARAKAFLQELETQISSAAELRKR